ncbi:calcitonin gene-related peptide type 1 receptor-like isoform X1 [Onthophagus taurus]|uniref:calcitonin gene-related peptide type 1 receptor-like isoform X1 n=1 Tax=Onthophagus taurus TaxID=166361 RepID=UPI0039BDFEBD
MPFELNKIGVFVILYFTSGICSQSVLDDREINKLFKNNKAFRRDESENISSKYQCRYRDSEALYPKDYWGYAVAGYCYKYTLPSRRNGCLSFGETRVSATENFLVPFINLTATPSIDMEGLTLFEYQNDTFVNEIIAPFFKTQLFVDQWLECIDNGIECCETFNDEDYNVNPTLEYPCPALWDGWQCWKSAKANTYSSLECPIYAITGGQKICNLYSQRECDSNGEWNHTTDTSGCALASIYRRRHNFHIIVLSISIVLIMPAIIIFLAFSKLRVAKDWETFNLPLYRNLLICIVVKNILTIISKDAVILDSLVTNSTETSQTILEGNGVWCRILAFFENLSKNLVFTCMVVIAYFLHKSIARFFTNGSNLKMYWLYLGVLGVSLIPSLCWAIVSSIFNNQTCWMVDENGYQWITDGFKYFILAINLLLLLDIIRVLLTGRVQTDRQTLKSAAKAILFLIPLFGVPLILTSQRSLFDNESCSNGYFYLTYSIEAIQGVIIAILFCYLSKKVHNEIKKSYRNFAINIEQRYNIRLWRPAQEPRKTATTNVRFSTSVNNNNIPRPSNCWETFT